MIHIVSEHKAAKAARSTPEAILERRRAKWRRGYYKRPKRPRKPAATCEVCADEAVLRRGLCNACHLAVYHIASRRAHIHALIAWTDESFATERRRPVRPEAL